MLMSTLTPSRQQTLQTCVTLGTGDYMLPALLSPIDLLALLCFSACFTGFMNEVLTLCPVLTFGSQVTAVIWGFMFSVQHDEHATELWLRSDRRKWLLGKQRLKTSPIYIYTHICSFFPLTAFLCLYLRTHRLP